MRLWVKILTVKKLINVDWRQEMKEAIVLSTSIDNIIQLKPILFSNIMKEEDTHKKFRKVLTNADIRLYPGKK